MLHIGGPRKDGNINFHLDYHKAYAPPVGPGFGFSPGGRHFEPASYTLQFVDGHWDNVHELVRWEGSEIDGVFAGQTKYHIKIEDHDGNVTFYLNGVQKKSFKTQHKQLQNVPVYIGEPGQKAAAAVTLSNLKISDPRKGFDEWDTARVADYEWSCDGATGKNNDGGQCKRLSACDLVHALSLSQLLVDLSFSSHF